MTTTTDEIAKKRRALAVLKLIERQRELEKGIIALRDKGYTAKQIAEELLSQDTEGRLLDLDFLKRLKAWYDFERKLLEAFLVMAKEESEKKADSAAS